MSRNQIKIDWDKVSRMIEAGCNGAEVAATLGIHANSLYRRCEKEHGISFVDYLAAKRASGRRLLRVKQFEIAMMGDKTMLIWLGKQRLEQSDKVESRNRHEIETNVQWRVIPDNFRPEGYEHLETIETIKELPNGDYAALKQLRIDFNGLREDNDEHIDK